MVSDIFVQHLGLENKPMRTLTLPMKHRYFDEIAAGTKRFEYRLVTPYFVKKLEGREYDRIVLTKGYPAGGGVLGETRLELPWRGYERQTITHEFFGPNPVEVFAILVNP
ncbi:RNA-binding protein [Caulobacter phage Sansa]|uniref:RNA-binding protein n=1 Tax=Caulobacter phage Sansa TaxID=1675600 RepID=A0A0K1LLW2_9CAUD|nr:RNA-binding protein [Caulobacter phage Sansa]AKU43502.1 RNA-binding protein [Caulobacter phage Sansa]